MSDELIYDTGALIAAERNSRDLWALHDAANRQGIIPAVPAGVLAEAWRGGPQPNISRLLKGCDVVAFTESTARRVGVLARDSGLADTVDLAVADHAIRHDAVIVTSNRTHIEQAIAPTGRRHRIHDV